MLSNKIIQSYLKFQWILITLLFNNRYIIQKFQQKFPLYNETIFYLNSKSNDFSVILTIDDGLSRGGKKNSLVPQVLNLLNIYKSTATFFVCTDYIFDMDSDINKIINSGHEFGNHLEKDISNYYNQLTIQEFDSQINKTNYKIEIASKTKLKWFRSPEGKLNTSMKNILNKYNMIHVLGDVFCHDHLINDPYFISHILLKQIKPGSIIVLHMPEINFREYNLKTLEKILENLYYKNINCLSLSNYIKKYS